MPTSKFNHLYYDSMGEDSDQQDEELLSQELDAIERSHPAYDVMIAELLEQAFRDDNRPRQYIKKDEIRDWLLSLLD
jgi:hypothetical protein